MQIRFLYEYDKFSFSLRTLRPLLETFVFVFYCLGNYKIGTLWWFEKAFPEIPPGLPF